MCISLQCYCLRINSKKPILANIIKFLPEVSTTYGSHRKCADMPISLYSPNTERILPLPLVISLVRFHIQTSNLAVPQLVVKKNISSIHFSLFLNNLFMFSARFFNWYVLFFFVRVL